jgi:hypothetical protein
VVTPERALVQHEVERGDAADVRGGEAESRSDAIDDLVVDPAMLLLRHVEHGQAQRLARTTFGEARPELLDPRLDLRG